MCVYVHGIRPLRYIFWSPEPSHALSLFQYVKDRVSRMQSENSFSNFAEAKPIFERSSKIACLQGLCPFDDAKVAPFLDVYNSRNPLVKVPVKQLPILKKFL